MQQSVPVINVSLVGPPNVLLQRAIQMALARGHLIVAAVGNDGPSAPPLYPAAYPGVVAVTAVDRADKVLIEAGVSSLPSQRRARTSRPPACRAATRRCVARRSRRRLSPADSRCGSNVRTVRPRSGPSVNS
ncbi:MAG: hypothetical protein IPF84_16605 [Proteobacteria bacterium]|nr:hypothetical protein [Pseudomonadota bacterium]